MEDEKSRCCKGDVKLVLACSGGSNVGQITNEVAKKLELLVGEARSRNVAEHYDVVAEQLLLGAWESAFELGLIHDALAVDLFLAGDVNH